MDIPKELQDLVLSHANLVGDGIAAFRAGDHQRCIDLLNKAIDKEKNNWQARLYLAMAYYSVGNIYTGAIHFRYLQEHCPEPNIKAQSASALKAMDRELKQIPKHNFWKRQEAGELY
jgi:tetratricopeptide (TPR) repeat protein